MNTVIYCRVSSKEQVEGTSLESQERACRDYATRNHLTVARVFTERGESAKFADRPELLDLLAYCKRRENEVRFLLVWKVDRLARNVSDHFSIKTTLLHADVQVVSVTEPIDANPEGKLLETILAGFAQFDNDLRAARTLQGMKSKIRDGLFPWKAPIGYISVTRGQKKTSPDVPDEPTFSLLRRGWKDFSTGMLSKAETLRCLTQRGLRTHAGRPVSRQGFDEILRDPFYAGMIRDPWSGEEHLGQHLPMVSRKLFDKVQAIIAQKSRSVPHRLLRTEFPLRRFIRCSHCEHGLTGGFSRGRSERYPYYSCWRNDCARRKSYPLEPIHQEFRSFLTSSSPTLTRISRIRDYAAHLIRAETTLNEALNEKSVREKARLTAQQERLIQMKLDHLITDEEFSKQRERIHQQLTALDSQRIPAEGGLDQLIGKFDSICKSVLDFGELWNSGSVKFQARFQVWALPSGYVHGRLRTAQKGRLFSLFASSGRADATLVHQGGTTLNQLLNEIGTLADLLGMCEESIC